MMFMQNNMILHLIALTVGLFMANASFSQTKPFDFQRFVDDDGIKREYLASFDSLLEATHSFDYLSDECNLDNTIYLPGREFIFEYYFRNKGKCYYFDFDGQSTLSECAHPNELTALKVGYEIEHGNLQGMTQVKYNYSNRLDTLSNFEKSGIIENKMNVWLHPPRSNQFRMTEINPFPYIKRPYEVGNTWTWDLEIGDQWGNWLWKEWNGNIKNQCFYTITGKEIISSAFGKILCYVVKSNAESEIGSTSLTAYFSEKFGFVKLFYTNIDGSELVMNLVKIKMENSFP